MPILTGCGLKLKNKYKMREHLRSHTQEKVVACPTCGGLFSSRTKFFDHLTRQASGTSGNQCSNNTLYTICIAPITQYTHVYNKNSNTQGSSPHVVKVIFLTLRNSSSKERIRSSLWEQTLSFKRSSHFEKG